MIYPDLPIKALSIRQPWCFAIMNAGKDIENRPRRSHFRGRVAVHASQYGLKRASAWPVDLYEAREFIQSVHGSCPALNTLQYGGIVGTVEIVDCVDWSDSLWFFKDNEKPSYGYVLRDPQPVDFIPVSGALGFFDWRKRL